MVHIGGKPILWHIMQKYAYYGHNEFCIALGYKSEVIKDYFLNYSALNSNFTVELSSGSVKKNEALSVDWSVTLMDTGLNTMTGGRLKRLKEWIGNETFLLTYGDGVSSININSLLTFHRQHGKVATVSAVHPSARFGELEIEGSRVLSFQEKPQLQLGWINGGYFVMEPEIIDYISGDETLLEREPLESLANIGQLMAYQHDGFWQCMDTKRDKELLEELWKTKSPPWKD